MLVLTRKLGESIQIGENISIAVVRVRGNRVQLGIQAPRDVPIFRDEVVSRDAVEVSGALEPMSEPA